MLNERLSRLLPIGQFATFMYALIDHSQNEDPHGLGRRAAGDPVARPRHPHAWLHDVQPDFRLGIEASAVYQTSQLAFPAGVEIAAVQRRPV